MRRASAPTATGCSSPSASAGRVSAVDRDGKVAPLLDGLPSAAAVDLLGDGYVVSAGTAVVLIDGDGNERRIDGFGDAQGVAVVGTVVLVADAGPPRAGRRRRRHRVGASVVVAGAPVGLPVPGVVPASFSPLAADGSGGFLVGCNGDGSIRRLTLV